MKKIFLFAFAALALGFMGCVEDDPYVGIVSVTHSPGSVTTTDDVTVTANVTGISSLTLKYKVNNGSEQSVTMTESSTKNVFTGIIPKQAKDATVSYYVTGHGITSATIQYKVSLIPVDYTKLVLNEINGDQKFIEIYNKGTVPIDLQGVKVDRNEGGSSYTQGTSVMIPAGGYAIVMGRAAEYVPNPVAPPSSPVIGELGSGISQGQSIKITLYAPDGSIIDTFIRLKANSGHTWGNSTAADYPNLGPYVRSPNGTGGWFTAPKDTGTAGAANPVTTTPILNLAQ